MYGDYFYGRGYSYGPPPPPNSRDHHHQQASSSRHPHQHPHHHHSHHHHHPHGTTVYPFRGRSVTTGSSAGRSPSPDSEVYSDFNAKSRMRWILSLGLLLPALAALIGVVAWAVSAEVVMSARRESALRASEAFRFSQDVETFKHDSIPTTTILTTISTSTLPPPTTVTASEGTTTSATSTSSKSPGDQVADVINRLVKERNAKGSRPHIVVVAPLTEQTKKLKNGTIPSVTLTSTLLKRPTSDSGRFVLSNRNDILSVSSISLTSTTTTTAKPIVSSTLRLLQDDVRPPRNDVLDDASYEDDDEDNEEDEDELTGIIVSEKSTLKPGTLQDFIPMKKKVDVVQIMTSSSSSTPSTTSSSTTTTTIRPHVVTMSTNPQLEKKVKDFGMPLTTDTSSVYSGGSPPILSKDADTLLAAAQMLAARRKFISMRVDDKNDDDDDDDEMDDEPQMKKETQKLTSPSPTSTSSLNVASTNNPSSNSGMISSGLPIPQPNHGNMRQMQIPPPQSHPHHLFRHPQPSLRLPVDNRAGPSPMASQYVPTHVLPPNAHPHLHSHPHSHLHPLSHHPRMIPSSIPPQQQVFRVGPHPVNGHHNQPINHIISPSQPIPSSSFVHHPLHGSANNQIRFVPSGGPHPQFLLPPGHHHPHHPHHQVLQPHPIPPPPPGFQYGPNVNQGPPSSAPPETDGEDTTEPTGDESQVSMNSYNSGDKKNGKAVIQFHAPDPQTAESGAGKGLTLHFGGGPIGGGTQLMTSPVGIFKTLLLPLLPKPRMNLNGKVVFGVVLEKSAGFGKQKHHQQRPRLVKFHPAQLYRP